MPPRPVPKRITLLDTLISKLGKLSSFDWVTPDLVDSITNLYESICGSVTLSREGFHVREQLHESIEKQISATATVLT